MNRHHNAQYQQTSTEVDSRKFYVQAREIVADLYKRNESRYWIDFILSVTAAYSLVSIFLALPLSSPLAWCCFFPGALLIYRASLFVHEIVHLPSDAMRRFRFCWNFFAGVPMMIPSFSYASHNDHHSSRHYGTDNDGEYLPLASGTMWGVLAFLSQIFFQPILAFLRYLILTPISFLHPKLRRWTLAHASSLVINFRHEKHIREGKETKADTYWELYTSFRAMLMIALVVGGVMPPSRLPKMLLIAVFVLAINHLRTLAAHRYRNEGDKMSHLDQFLDSTNVSGNWLTELICPLGLRYHALHHLFPGLPYHNLGRAHRRLTEQLPRDSVYHDATYPNLRSVVVELLATIRARKIKGRVMA